jgi:hypothetical protein
MYMIVFSRQDHLKQATTGFPLHCACQVLLKARADHSGRGVGLCLCVPQDEDPVRPVRVITEEGGAQAARLGADKWPEIRTVRRRNIFFF